MANKLFLNPSLSQNCCYPRQTATLATVMLALSSLFYGEALATEIGSTTIARWKDDRQAPLMLMFDDSMQCHVKTVLPELKKRQLTGTFYINPGSGHYKALKSAWEKEFHAAGMVLANHTFTHKGAKDVGNCEEEITKCNEVLEAIAMANVGKKPTLMSFGRPGVPKGAWNVTDEELKALLKKHRLVLRPNVLFAQIHLKDTPEMIARVEKAIASGKPETVAFHGVGGEWLSIDMLAFLALLDFIDVHRAQIWVTDPISIHKYETERDSAKLKVLDSGAQQIRVALQTQADTAVYDAPLTLITHVPADWKTVEVAQGSLQATIAVTKDKTEISVVKYDARPGKEPIILTGKP